MRVVLLLCLSSTVTALIPFTRGIPRTTRHIQTLRGGASFIKSSAPSPDLEADREEGASFAELDRSIDRSVALSSEKEVILQFQTNPSWILRQYAGTVIEITWRSCLLNMLFGAIVSYVVRFGFMGHLIAADWPLFTPPIASHPVISRLSCVNVMWEYMVGLATFILTFFLGQAYSYWRAQLGLVRSVQGRLNDICMMTAAFAERNADGAYTPAARKLLEDTARNVRLLHILYWAGLDGSLSSLRTAAGLDRLVQRGVMTEREQQTLIASGLRSTKRHEVVLQWILYRVLSSGGGSEGKAGNGAMLGGGGFEGSFADTCKQLRAACGTVPDQMVERMPLAYVHIVHVMIDLLLLLAPVALYPKVGALVVPLAGVLTLFYRGLLFLAMSFLDPFGNEGSRAQNINSDVLITEVNRNSNAWWRASEAMPFDKPAREIKASA